jgi:Tol biopolymer transport system component
MTVRLAALACLMLIALPRGFTQPASEAIVRTVWQDSGDGAMMSPDGKLIAFVDWNVGQVAVREAATGSVRQLPDSSSGFPEPYFTFSPDSSQLLFPFANDRDGDPFRYELRSIDLRSGAHQSLAVFPADVGLIVPLAWHVKAGILLNKLAADGSSELLMLDPATKSVRVLQRRTRDAGLAWQAEFNREGSGAVILANNALSWINIADGAVRALGIDAHVMLGWSPDERALIVHTLRANVFGNWSIAMSSGKPVGSPVLLHRTAAGVRWAGRSAEGLHFNEPAATPRLFVAGLDVTAGRLVSDPQPILPTPGYIAGHPAWSRDGSRIAFTVTIPNRNEARLFVAEGIRGVAKELVQLDLRVTGVDWSADGRFIIVGGRAMTRDTSWIGRVNAATGAIEKLVTGAPSLAVAAGAGDAVVFSRPALTGSRNVHLMHVRGPGAAPRIVATYAMNEGPRSMSVSPDGRSVAILKAVPASKATALLLLPTAGGEPRTVLQMPRPDALELNQGTVPWTPDGRSVIVMMRRQGRRQLAAVSVDSGEIRVLPFIPREGGRRHFALHPDGRQLVYADEPARDHLKVMPNIF